MLLVIAPLQAAVSDRIGTAEKSAEILKAGRACVETAVPQLIQQASNDYAWAAGTAIRVTFGLTPIESLIDGRGPACEKVRSLLKPTGSKPGATTEVGRSV